MNRVRGAVMMEALAAALIFALAAIAIVGFQARATRLLNDAHFRVEARHLAHSALARMQAADNATLYAEFDMRAGGAGYRAVAAQAQRLPGVGATSNAPQVLITPGHPRRLARRSSPSSGCCPATRRRIATLRRPWSEAADDHGRAHQPQASST